MPLILTAEQFSEERLPDVEEFCCGNEVWSTASEEWIKAPADSERGAIWSIKRHHNQVWLYFSPSQQLVGFGAVGPARWRWPLSGGLYKPWSYIPQIAVAFRFRGPPAGPKSERYSHQIMAHLILESLAHDTELLGLHVHRDNSRAIAFYQGFNFHMHHEDAGEYRRMFRLLRTPTELS